MRSPKVNKDLYEKALAYFREQNKQYAVPKPTAPPELARFESEFPGCSLGAYPWPDRKVVYRVVPMMSPAPTRLISTHVSKYMLVATYAKDTLAYWSVVGQNWVIVCPHREELDSPWSAP